MHELPILPEAGRSGCGGGCGSGLDRAAGPSESVKTEWKQTNVAFSERRLRLDATPTDGTFVSVIDLDLTVECNLRCVYCFKEKWNEHMEDRTAFDAVLWLLHASGPQRNVTVNFMGGEPLLRFKLIRSWCHLENAARGRWERTFTLE